MTKRPTTIVAGLGLLALLLLPLHAAERQTIPGHVPAAVAKLKLPSLGRLAATNRIYMVIGLPPHNLEGLTNLIRQLYDPASTNFHQYLTPPQVTAKFGATDAEYQTVLQFAITNGLTVVRTHDDRRIMDVGGTVEEIENAFHIHLLTYQHPTENRQFYAPDVEPSVDADVPILCISGLNNYSRHYPGAHPVKTGKIADGQNGSGYNGLYLGKDFRSAYAPDVTLTGNGQTVGLVELGGFYQADITAYEQQAGLPSVPIITDAQYCDPGYDTASVLECSLDIEMVMAMAPGIANIWVFEGNDDTCTYFSGGDFDDILDSMTSESQIKIFSSSWNGGGFDAIGSVSLAFMAIQGQTFFQSAGDGNAYTQAIVGPSDSIYATIVGGTSLTLDATGTNYGSETVWNQGFSVPAWGGNGGYDLNGVNGGYWGSGGGVSSTYGIPEYQTFVNMAAVGGSTTMRNIPDLAMTAQSIYVVANGVTNNVGGTSAATPLWAGFLALVNEQAVNQGLPPVGFLNPVLYKIGLSTSYTNVFHDITTGNNYWPGSPSLYNSAPGYDLCTGWGSPKGQATINALVSQAVDVWVYFDNPSAGAGTYDDPFSTLAAGVSAVQSKGTIGLIGPASSSETPRLNKPMILRAYDAPVFIGIQH